MCKRICFSKKLSELDCVENIFVASGNDAMKEFCTCVDIREDEDVKLLEFAMENSIDLTVVSSEKAIKADIAGFLKATVNKFLDLAQEPQKFVLANL